MNKTKTNIELGGLFYPTKDEAGNPVPFESLFIPYIYKEIEFDGLYIDILNQRSDMVIVDVGANIGITANHFRKHAKKLYAIEPSPEHFAALKQNKEFNHWDNVKLLNYALADKDGELEFTQNTLNRTMNTLAVGVDDGSHQLDVKLGTVPLKMNAQGYDTTVKVATKSIDHFMEENNIEQVDFMKFDVEGAEDLILRSDGFKKVCDKIKAIEVEFHFPNWRELADYLIDLGYTARRYDCSAIVVLFSR